MNRILYIVVALVCAACGSHRGESVPDTPAAMAAKVLSESYDGAFELETAADLSLIHI